MGFHEWIRLGREDRSRDGECSGTHEFPQSYLISRVPDVRIAQNHKAHELPTATIAALAGLMPVLW